MNRPKKEKYFSKNEVLSKLMNFCAYQERSHSDVRKKLYAFHLNSDEKEEIISYLIENNYINESRFADVYAGGKFRLKKWGRVKIEKELGQHQVSEKNISKAIAHIDEKEYLNTLKALIEKKWNTTSEVDLVKKKYKVARYLISKGYEQELIFDLLEKYKS